jgi:hypothetical protein
MTPEAGKRYVLANGDITGPMHFDPDSEQPFTAVVKGCWCHWYVDGCFFDGRISDFDIVSEYVEPRKPREQWPVYDHIGNQLLSGIENQHSAARLAAGHPDSTVVRFIEVMDDPS